MVNLNLKDLDLNEINREMLMGLKEKHDNILFKERYKHQLEQMIVAAEDGNKEIVWPGKIVTEEFAAWLLRQNFKLEGYTNYDGWEQLNDAQILTRYSFSHCRVSWSDDDGKQ